MLLLFGYQIPIFDAITLLLAFWGAGLSTFLGIREWRKNKRRVHVNCFVGKEHVPMASFDNMVDYLIVEAVNTGHRSVTITAAGFRIGTKPFLIIDDREDNPAFGSVQPKTLADGEKAMFSFWGDDAELNFRSLSTKDLRRCRAFVRDAEGHEYFSSLSKEWSERFLSPNSSQEHKEV